MKKRIRLNPIDAVVLTVLIGGFIFVAFHGPITSALFWITGNSEQLQQDQPSSPAPAENDQKQVNSPENPESSEMQAPQKPQEPAKIAETYARPSESAKAPAAPQSAPQPAKNEAGGHIPFTNKPVTAGDPESYIDTVGQCPFYEMAGEKGCVPPEYIECNADWSICTLKEEKL